MNPASPERSGGRDAPVARQPADSQPGKTPNTEMQAEDAGSADSGTEAVRAMKQTSKTPTETQTSQKE